MTEGSPEDCLVHVIKANTGEYTVHRNKLVQLQHRKSYQTGISSGGTRVLALAVGINETNARSKHCELNLGNASDNRK